MAFTAQAFKARTKTRRIMYQHPKRTAGAFVGVSETEKMGALGKIYLCTYNVVQAFGWSVILYTLLSHYVTSSELTLWDKVWFPLFLFQTAAVVEVVHIMVGLVRSNVFITFVQVLSRVAVCGILLTIPSSLIVSSIAFPLTILAWSITEIIRYSYYFTNLVGYTPYFLTWLRYTTFIVLYPLGITGELLCYYMVFTYSQANPEVLTYALPNQWNFTFNYSYSLIMAMLVYIPGFPNLYSYMLSQRKKILGSDAKAKKKH
ncbi:hypothetical protein KPH14_004603 [Odynerus spinipes]|uniref:Very-long-chain (3R)-3-hydroxyacyl-CoA dehydratase n=1 Tax=Odynerus spinipes TaxID=1348599 RepID=A0AAD9VQE3_9HYME|nr:hypothetical protein KPH14_004603 [Odynerus spinipes]